MPTRCNRGFLLQILVLAQHVSGTTMPIISSSRLLYSELHGYTVHQIMLNTFYYQLTHTTLKNVELLKHSKINKNAPTCFGLH